MPPRAQQRPPQSLTPQPGSGSPIAQLNPTQLAALQEHIRNTRNQTGQEVTPAMITEWMMRNGIQAGQGGGAQQGQGVPQQQQQGQQQGQVPQQVQGNLDAIREWAVARSRLSALREKRRLTMHLLHLSQSTTSTLPLSPATLPPPSHTFNPSSSRQTRSTSSRRFCSRSCSSRRTVGCHLSRWRC